jgi:HEAT repeat protein
MSLKMPRLRLRFKLRTLTILIALVAISLWAGLAIWSPTRRLGRQLQADQPVYIRREAAASLGRAIPPWEVDDAVRLLLAALEDPSPRVRESATVGLVEVGSRAQRAVTKLTALLGDDDRFVRFAAARALGMIGIGTAMRAETVTALTRTLDDTDPDVRVVAAEALVSVGEPRKGAGTLVDALCGTDSRLRSWARTMIQKANDARPFIALLAVEMRSEDSDRRDEALETMLLIAAPDAVKSALNAAAGCEDAQVRRWAAARLERSSD